MAERTMAKLQKEVDRLEGNFLKHVHHRTTTEYNLIFVCYVLQIYVVYLILLELSLLFFTCLT